MAELTALCDATIFTGEAFVEGHALVLSGSKILDIAPHSKIAAGAEKISCAGQIIVPGFIDAQVNGGDNILLNNTPDAAACLAIARAHRKHGTTRLLLTCISDRVEVTRKAAVAVREARRTDKGILGIHIEGPHLGNARRGVHKAEFLRTATSDDFELYKRDGDEAMLLTVAPENITSEQIQKLCAEGIFVALGHSQATAEQTREALAAGASGFTHLYNGMEPVSARVPGVAGAALDDRASWCSLIADEHHVSPELVRLALRAKPPGKVFLVSDAMPPSAADATRSFELYGETINVENGRCINKEGKLAGAILTMAEAVRNCITKFGIEPAEALAMASANPAAFLGVGHLFGKLLPGFEADVLALDTQFNIKKIWMSGKQI